MSKQNVNNNNKKNKKQNKKNTPNNNVVPKINRFKPSIDLGTQLSNVVKHGYGATLATYPSVVNFAHVYGFPFSNEEARLPFLPVYSSKVVKSVLKGIGQLNNAGIGFISYCPETMMVNDVDSVWWSDQSTSPSTISKAGPGAHSPAQKTTFKESAFWIQSDATAIQGRVVSSGIRVKYIGTVLDAAGTFYSGQTNPRISLDSFSATGMENIPGYKEAPFRTGGWHTLTRHISSEEDKQFLQLNKESGIWVDATSRFNVMGANLNYMGAIFNGTGNAKFEFEVATHFEVVGPNLDSVAITQIDSGTGEKVINELAEKRHIDNSTPDHFATPQGPVKQGAVGGLFRSIAKKALPLAEFMIPEGNLVTKGLQMIKHLF
jgi:hypothetical protein